MPHLKYVVGEERHVTQILADLRLLGRARQRHEVLTTEPLELLVVIEIEKLGHRPRIMPKPSPVEAGDLKFVTIPASHVAHSLRFGSSTVPVPIDLDSKEELAVTTPVSAQQAPRQRRRVRVALATLRRVRYQRERFATEYGAATTAQGRFAAAANTLRAAAADGSHQPDPDEAARGLSRITELITALIIELHERQEDQANHTIRADERRIERNERRRGHDGRSRVQPGTDAGTAA